MPKKALSCSTAAKLLRICKCYSVTIYPNTTSLSLIKSSIYMSNPKLYTFCPIFLTIPSAIFFSSPQCTNFWMIFQAYSSISYLALTFPKSSYRLSSIISTDIIWHNFLRMRVFVLVMGWSRIYISCTLRSP